MQLYNLENKVAGHDQDTRKNKQSCTALEQIHKLRMATAKNIYISAWHTQVKIVLSK